MNPIQPESDRGSVLSAWDLLPLVAAVGLLWLSQSLWNRLPDPVPTHFGVHGQPNGWTPKDLAPWVMFGFPGFLWLLLVVIGAWAVPSAQGRAAQQRRCMAPMRGLTVLGLFVLMSLVVLMPVFGQVVFWPIFGTFFALLFLGIGLMVRLGYLHASADEKRFWKWGLFYVNPEDSRLWVPKRFSVGWTLNFAQPWSWVVMLLLFLPLLLLVFFLRMAR
jgi:uncharacterized membrane protein